MCQNIKVKASSSVAVPVKKLENTQWNRQVEKEILSQSEQLRYKALFDRMLQILNKDIHQKTVLKIHEWKICQELLNTMALSPVWELLEL